MNNCIYYYNESGKIVNIETLPDEGTKNISRIGNERQLDGYLYDHRDDLMDNITSIDITSDIPHLPENADKTTVELFIQQMHDKANGYSKSPKKFDTTAIWERIDPLTFGSKKTFEEVQKEKAEQELKEELPNFNTLSDDEKAKLIEKKVSSKNSKWRADVGDMVSKALSIGLKRGINAIDSELPVNKDLFPTLEQSENFYKSIKSAISKLISELKKLPGGQNAKWELERAVFTDQVNDSFLQTLSAISKNSTNSVDIIGILGRVDITGITPEGKVLTIEMKTTGKTLPSGLGVNNGTMFPGTLNQYAAQVLTYDIIRKQHGLNTTPYLLNMYRADNGTISFDKIIEIPTVNTDEHGMFMSIVNNGLPLHTKVKVENVEQTTSEMTGMFGENASVASELQTVKRDIEFFLDRRNKFVKEVDSTMPAAQKAGYVYYFIDRTSIKPEYIYAKNEDELRKNLQSYLEKLDQQSASAWVNFADKFRKIKSIKDLRQTLIDLGYGGKALDTVANHLFKYVAKKWELVNDPVLIANGMLLFRTAGSSEIVMLEELKGLFEYHDFQNHKKGTTVLGKKYGDWETGSANRHILSGQYGNLLLMKAMSIISHNPEMFNSAKIAKISAINPRRGEIVDTVLNSTVIWNWKLLSANYRDLQLKQVDHVFMSDVQSCVLRAKQFVQLCEHDHFNNSSGSLVFEEGLETLPIMKTKTETDVYTYSEILKLSNSLINRFGDRSDKLDPRIRMALDELDAALLAISNLHVSTELDNPKYFAKGLSGMGSYMTPFYRSTSSNLRLVSEISESFHYVITEEMQKYTSPFQVKLSKALSKNPNYNSAVSSEYIMSEAWFVRDKDGNIDKSFRVLPPSDSYFDTRQEERELLEYVLETFAELRWGDQAQYIENLKSDPESKYYEMPLFESGFRETIKTSSEPIKSTANLAKKKVKRFFNWGTELFQGQERQISDDESILDAKETEDPFYDPHREDKLDQFGPDVYTKNIDEIFLYSVLGSLKRRQSAKLLPMFTAVRHLMHKMNVDNGAGMKHIEDAVKQYIKTVILERPGVESSLIPYQRFIQALRQMFSVTTLGLNPKNLTRDTISSSLRSAITFLDGKDGRTLGINSKEYFSAFAEIAHNMDSVFTSHGYYNKLNLIHRVANMSYREIADQLKINKYSIGNVDSNFLFLTSTAPDFVHRMAILKAYLKKLGADEAYVIGEDGIMTYDMSKDKRWELLYKYKSGDEFSQNDRNKVPEGEERKKYDEVWTKYVESIYAWKKSKPDIKIGDELPLALDPTQEMSMKSLSHNLYGAYDKDAQALVHQTLIGGAFFQFKTYGITRMVDWWRSAGQINILNNDYLYDENGKKLYERLNDAETVASTGEFSTLVTEDEVTSQELASGRVRPLRGQFGQIDEGRIQSAYAFAILGYGAYVRKDEAIRKDLELRMQDPMTRGNILKALLDTFSALMIFGFIKIVYPEEARNNMSNQDWWTRWTYSMLTGVASDGPIWEVFNSIWGGGKIPVVEGVSRWFASAMSVIHGDQFLPAMFNTFGATRELTSLFKDL